MGVLTCTRCGQENPEIARFCLACGVELEKERPTRREERRLVSVIFVDLVGSTETAERLDPEDVHAMLTRYYERVRDEIESFGGVVLKFIGDAIVGLFGAPVSFGDDAERAVRAALASRDALRDLGVDGRIAVNTGDALVAIDERAALSEAIVTGDVVNTAYRLQEAAPTNAVLVGHETYDATRGAIHYEPTAPVVAKGKSEPVEAWLAIRATAPAGERVVSDAPMVGRKRELEVLRGIWQRVAAERSPHLVTVFGGPGLGKTRLGLEFARVVDERGGRTVRGRSLPYRESTAYGALAMQVKELAGIFESDPVDVALEKLRRTVMELVGDSDAAEVAGHLAILLGLDPTGSVSDRETLFFSVRSFIDAVARDKPTLLVFEDLHWADDSLLDLIELLAARLQDVPILLLALARPELLEGRSGWGGGLFACSALPLDALNGADARELAAQLLKTRDDAAPQAERVAETAAGNPLFIEQLVATVSEQSTSRATGLPTTIRGILAARLDGLPAFERATLLDAAVSGRVFWRGALELTSEEPDRLPEALAALEARDLIHREAAPRIEGEHEFSFKHVLIRDVAYELLPRARRREKHAKVADFLERATSEMGEVVAQLARHWREAGEPERAVAHLILAAEEAERGWAKERAVALYREAGELVPEDDDARRRELRRRQALAQVAVTHVRDVHLLRGGGEN